MAVPTGSSHHQLDDRTGDLLYQHLLDMVVRFSVHHAGNTDND
jgi:hypothetical protein